MRNCNRWLGIGLLLAAGSACAHVDVPAEDLPGMPGGQVSYRGAVTTSPCTLSAASQYQTVRMGQVNTAQFSGVGSFAGLQPFTLDLQQCDPTILTTVGVIFRGISDGKDPQVFAVNGGAYPARGVGVALFDSEGELLLPNTAPREMTSLQPGNNALQFSARFRATDSIPQPGEVNALTNFTLVYQ